MVDQAVQVAQLVECLHSMPDITGSTPTATIENNNRLNITTVIRPRMKGIKQFFLNNSKMIVKFFRPIMPLFQSFSEEMLKNCVVY